MRKINITILVVIAIIVLVFGLCLLKFGGFADAKRIFCNGIEISENINKYEKFCHSDSDCVKTNFSYKCCGSCYLDAVNGMAEKNRQKWNEEHCKNVKCATDLCVRGILNNTPACVFNQCILK